MTRESTILIIDDEPVILKLLGRLLQDDYKVQLFNSGAKALDYCKKNHLPDLILLDVSMPDMDGFEVLRQLKTASRTAAIPVIFVTARVEDMDEEAGFELGAVDYIGKPIRPAIVKARVQAQLELKHTRDNLELIVKRRTAALYKANLELKKNLFETVKSFSYLIEQRDPELAEHSRRVADKSRKLAVEMGMQAADVDDVFLAGLLSRIGSITLSEKMLSKPMHMLEKADRELLIDNIISAKILFLKIGSLKKMAELIENQYEHFGGSGIPAGKIGEQIPLGSRIIAVVRDYDLLRSGKLGARQYSTTESIEYMRRYSGKYYDPAVLDAYLKTFGKVAEWVDEKFAKIALVDLIEGMNISEVRSGDRIYVRNLIASADIIKDLKEIQADTGQQFDIFVKAGKSENL